MKPLARLGYLAAACALLVTTFAIIGPRTAHALVATLVQVVNTNANPVPVVNAPVVLVGNGSADLAPDLGPTDFGPFDVSSYSNIRFYGDPAGITTAQVTFELLALDASGNLFVLDTLSATSQSGAPSAFVTGAYSIPGASLKVRVFALCSSSCPSTVHTNFVIYGR
jgi:hypothetical protein